MKNISHIACIIGKKHKVDPEIVEQALNNFFKRVEKTMNSCEHAYVRVEHVGLFLMKPKLINKQILRYIEMIRQLPKAHWRKETNSKIVSELRLKLRILLARRNEVATTIYNHRLQKQKKYSSRMAQ